MLNAARRDRSCLYIGLDAAAENVADSARVANREPVANAMFVAAGIERAPEELTGVADRITVLFPWGSLLKGIVRGEAPVLGSVVRMAQPGAAIDILVNRSIFADPAVCARYEISEQAFLSSALRGAYARAGISVVGIAPVGTPLPHVTTWGQKVARDGEALRLTARVVQDVRVHP